MKAYYNEFDPFAAAWLRELIKAGLIADGDVDERSIEDVQASDLVGYTQCHFFAGIGGWSYALRLAGWPDEQPVWTGSCPCQPFSSASADAQGHADRRNLWPELFRLIRESQPAIVFGEQVSQAVGWGWWDRAAMDCESASYACAAAVMRSDPYGAISPRPRLYWVADALREGLEGLARGEALRRPNAATDALDGQPLAEYRRIVAGHQWHLLPGDGVSLGMERGRIKGYGNAINPVTAASFIRAYAETKAEKET